MERFMELGSRRYSGMLAGDLGHPPPFFGLDSLERLLTLFSPAGQVAILRKTIESGAPFIPAHRSSIRRDSFQDFPVESFIRYQDFTLGSYAYASLFPEPGRDGIRRYKR